MNNDNHDFKARGLGQLNPTAFLGSEISLTDIQEVITEIFPNETFTEKEIAKVQELYPTEAESDPTGYWRLWVENLLYQTINARDTGGL